MQDIIIKMNGNKIMKKLFFIVMITLHATLTYTSGTMSWQGNNPTSSGFRTPNKIAYSYVPKSQLKPSETRTSSSSKTLCDENTSLAMQQMLMLILLDLEQQKQHEAKDLQKQKSRPKRHYDDSHRKADAATIAKWKLRGKTATASTTHVQSVASEASVESDAKVTACMQMRAILAACIDEDETFWKLRDVYVDSGCEEPADEIPDLPENACYSIPSGATAAFYGVSYGASFAGSAIGSAFLAAAPPLVICAVVYTGGKFIVNLIKNYKQSKYETAEFKTARDAAEKYRTDLQYALNRTLNIGSVNAIPTNPIYYAMSYGYENDPYAKVVTIVDSQQKQHIFVVPEDVNKWPFQISHGSMDHYFLIDPRYLVPQSTIDEVLSMQRNQKQKAQEVKNDKAKKNKNKTTKPSQKPSSQQSQATQPSQTSIPQQAPQVTESAQTETSQESQATEPAEMSASEPTIPEQQGCGHVDPELNKPKIFTSPMPEPHVPSNEGCGSTQPVEKPTDTAHEPNPVQDQSLPGCEGMDQASQRPDLFNAKKGNDVSRDVKTPPKVEPKEGSPEWNNLHPHGKTHDSNKHHPHSRDGIGKPPRDAQSALDKSFEVKGSKERVATEDGKIVILKETSNGLYHGYVVDDFHSIKNANVKQALVKNGLVNNIKSGKVIK